MNNIYLVGFMGTGKTSVGKEVARRIKRHFVDLDELIELKEKRPIPQIFAREGEPYFRRIEKLVLKEVSIQDDFVVACGGGIVTNEDNIKLMKNTGVIVCLSACVESIIKRTSSCLHRPLLNVPNPREQIEGLLKERQRFYSQAHHTIDTSCLSVNEVADKLLELIPS